jgi:2-polyprenyl-3-methyl-5-hydroxy-6-metoxy-1,4-benzoquinol methylase
MGQELSKKWYDDVFDTGGSEEMYFLNYRDTPWYPVWTRIIEILKENNSSKILDIGCGPGQFAHCVLDGIDNIEYTGIDFSSSAINSAKSIDIPATFIESNALTFDYSTVDYDVVVSTEFLEHVYEDKEIINRITPGTLIIATLPNMDSEGHVRFLSKNQEIAVSEIVNHYSDICKILNIEYFPYTDNPENADFLIQMIKL